MLGDFITIAEAETYNILRIRAMETRETATMPTDDRYLALPDRFAEMRKMQLDTAPRHDIISATLESLGELGNTVPGKPLFFAVTSQLNFDRKSDSAYTVVMWLYKKFAALSDSNTSNFMTTTQPHILLWGSMWQFYDYIEDDKNSQKYEAKWRGAIDRLNKSDKKGRFGPAPAARSERPTP